MDTLLYAALSNAAVIALLAPAVSVFGRMSRRPALVHSLWLLVLLKLFTPPLWPLSLSWLVDSDVRPVMRTSTGLEPELPVEPVEPSANVPPVVAAGDLLPETAGPIIAATTPLGPASPLPEESAATPAPLPPQTSNAVRAASSFCWRAWLISIWFSGSGVWLTLACLRIGRFHRFLRLARRAPLSLQNRVRHLAERLGLATFPEVWIVPAPVSPLLWALAGTPRLVVPESLLQRLTDEQWDTLLAHELAHLRRGDHWVRFLELASFGLYWWHPMVWWARRELREVEEQCCDAWVVWALPGAAEIYASALLEAVTYLSSARSALPLAASGIGHMHLLKRRLTMIMRGTTPRALSTAGSLAVLGLAAILLPLYPSWTRTGEAAEAGGGQQPPGGTATTAGRPSTGAETVSVPTTEAQEDPVPGAPAGDVGGRGIQATGGEPYGGSRERRPYPETVEDAQDEVDLLSVQLDLRRAERNEAQARVRQAQNDNERVSRLLKSRSIDSAEAERAHTELEVQAARLAAKEAQIREAELRLKQAERRLTNLRGQAPQAGGGIMGRGRGSVGIGHGAGSGAGGDRRFGVFGPGVPAAPGGVGSASGPVGRERGMGPSGFGSSSSSGMQGGGFGTQGGNFPGPVRGGFSGGAAGGSPGPNSGESARGPGTAASFDLRLRDVEKKLQSLIEDMKALRREQPDDKPQSPKR